MLMVKQLESNINAIRDISEEKIKQMWQNRVKIGKSIQDQ